MKFTFFISDINECPSDFFSVLSSICFETLGGIGGALGITDK